MERSSILVVLVESPMFTPFSTRDGVLSVQVAYGCEVMDEISLVELHPVASRTLASGRVHYDIMI